MPNRKRILLAEDEEHLLEAIKLNLELEGYKVSTATNGKKALQIFNIWFKSNISNIDNYYLYFIDYSSQSKGLG